MNPLFIRRLKRSLVPPAVAWRIDRRSRELEEQERFRKLYSSFVSPGDLCFDVGANLGNRVRSLRAIGCRVVAIEPQPDCQKQLHKQFGRDPEVVIVGAAASSKTGRTTLRISPDHVLSSLSEEFISRTSESGRFADSVWDRSIEVETVTLDNMISSHGIPAFVKIDVEGSEAEVIGGLTHPIRAISFEWTPEFPENSLRCVDSLSAIGDYEFTWSAGESMMLSPRGWRSAASIKNLIEEMVGETFFFGDIYARLKQRDSTSLGS